MLHIDTFSQHKGGQSFFKALGHPVAAEKMASLLKDLASQDGMAIYDPAGWLRPFSELYDLSGLMVERLFVQKYEDFGSTWKGLSAEPLTALETSQIKGLLIADFDQHHHLTQIGHLLPKGCRVASFDDLKLPEALLTNPKRYLDPLNFATNFAFFREEKGLHTRLFTANYWSSYSGASARVSLWLVDDQGKTLAQWDQDLGAPGASFILDSQDIKKRFDLPDFCGQLFLHVVGASGHDVVKYALDTYSDDGDTLSCTHDANAWPADYYAGLPAPRQDEEVVLWVQNSHPCPIPGGTIGLNPMGQDQERRFVEDEVPPFGTLPVSVGDLFPQLHWPQQLEILAGKHFVRPRYEVVRQGKRRIAHANVERTDLKSNSDLKSLAPHFGKGFILPAPILPWDQWQSEALPTPMARHEQTLPVALLVYDASGREIGEHRFGKLKRSDSVAVIVNDVLQASRSESDELYGHMEMVYDFEAGDEANGWLHGLFRYENKVHQAETIFGAHIFNTALTYKDQPFSYRGGPPGLTTRLFLRSGPPGTETLCHLIYPASTHWHPASSTQLLLYSGQGDLVAESWLSLPCGGSHFWRLGDVFSETDRRQAGSNHYVMIRDKTCRLFGYHGAIDGKGRFSLDHMFGF